MKKPTLFAPQLDIHKAGAIYALDYQDKYFSETDGLAETRTVYLEGNRLPSRWRGERQFVIAELGFGSGLNFLATWQAWVSDPQRCDRLYYVAVEQAPVPPSVIAGLAVRWPVLQAYAEALIAAYPPLTSGHHGLSFADDRVQLLLAWGDAESILPEWQLGVDAWYLDGFAPSRNPAMWSLPLLKWVARNTRIGGTMATFTAAGQVRRDLQAVGFAVNKRPGFGGKRERLVGDFTPPSPKQASQIVPRSATDIPAITIVGAGLAGMLVAWELRQQSPDTEITLITPGSATPLAASSNPAAMVLPQLSSVWTARSYLHWQAFLAAQRFYPALQKALSAYRETSLTGDSAAWLWQGEAVRQLPERVADVDQAILAESLLAHQIPESLAWLSEDGLHFRNAMTIDGGRLLAQLRSALQHPDQPGASLRLITGVLRGWTATGQPMIDGVDVAPQPIIYVLGAGSISVIPADLTIVLHTTHGQLNLARATAESRDYNRLLSADGYLTPVFPGDDRHYVGSSFDRTRPYGIGEADPAETGRLQQRLASLTAGFGAPAQVAYAGCQADEHAFAAWRLHSQDRFPLVGRLPDPARIAGLSGRARDRLISSKPHFHTVAEPFCFPDQYLLTGLGAHGFCLAPLLAKSLVADLFDIPQPLAKTLRRRAHPLWQWLQQSDDTQTSD